jgi:hypothetical protein
VFFLVGYTLKMFRLGIAIDPKAVVLHPWSSPLTKTFSHVQDYGVCICGACSDCRKLHVASFSGARIVRQAAKNTVVVITALVFTQLNDKSIGVRIEQKLHFHAYALPPDAIDGDTSTSITIGAVLQS